jgi:hypothetical protein
MSEIASLFKFIEDSCKLFALTFSQVSEHNCEVFTDEASGITLFIEIKDLNDFSFYFSERTHDVFHRGDRTDIHVILSLMFVSFLQASGFGITCALYDIQHPVCEDEIYGRYIVPMQVPGIFGIATWEQIKIVISEIIYNVYSWRQMFWSYAGCVCEDCRKEAGVESVREYDDSTEITGPLEKRYGMSERINSGSRVSPDWEFSYDIEHEVTIVKSDKLCAFIDSIQSFNRREKNDVDGINGKLILDGEINNFLKNKHLNELQKLFSLLLHKHSIKKYTVIPLENMIIASCSPYIIALGRLCGVNEFREEKELLRKRHNNEANLLFPVTSFEWSEDVCPEQFEKLIKMLLEREPNVKSVRRPAPLNQGDKGRDLIIDWAILKDVMTITSPPTSIIKVVGQCKASNSTIGKNKVLDIRDTVETHNALGFFLAVSTQISAPLTEKLEELREKGIWTQWWNREDIESRLLKCVDLVAGYPNVLKPKNKVKYVDKED